MSKDKKGCGCGCGCLSVLCVIFVLGAIGSSVSENTTSNAPERTVLQNENVPADTQIPAENPEMTTIAEQASPPDTPQTQQEPITAAAETPAEATTQVSGDAIQAAIESGDYSLVTPAFKQTMDSYEQFFDQYIAFMNKYKNADSMDVLSMINEYSQFMTNYVKMMDSMEKLGDSEMTTADSIYYIMVTARIEAKLVGVIGE